MFSYLPQITPFQALRKRHGAVLLKGEGLEEIHLLCHKACVVLTAADTDIYHCENDLS